MKRDEGSALMKNISPRTWMFFPNSIPGEEEWEWPRGQTQPSRTKLPNEVRNMGWSFPDCRACRVGLECWDESFVRENWELKLGKGAGDSSLFSAVKTDKCPTSYKKSRSLSKVFVVLWTCLIFHLWIEFWRNWWSYQRKDTYICDNGFIFSWNRSYSVGWKNRSLELQCEIVRRYGK